jgi:hypothetical protein
MTDLGRFYAVPYDRHLRFTSTRLKIGWSAAPAGSRKPTSFPCGSSAKTIAKCLPLGVLSFTNSPAVVLPSVFVEMVLIKCILYPTPATTIGRVRRVGQLGLGNFKRFAGSHGARTRMRHANYKNGRVANCEVNHALKLNFVLARADRAEAAMQTKPRTHNAARVLEKPAVWAGRAMIALVLLCESYFIVDIIRMLRTAYAS